MRISDWSSDVCSSDVAGRLPGQPELAGEVTRLWRSVRSGCPHILHQIALAEDPRIGELALFISVATTDGQRHLVGEVIVEQIGRAHVCTPVINAHLVCRLLLENKT